MYVCMYVHMYVLSVYTLCTNSCSVVFGPSYQVAGCRVVQQRARGHQRAFIPLRMSLGAASVGVLAGIAGLSLWTAPGWKPAPEPVAVEELPLCVCQPAFEASGPEPCEQVAGGFSGASVGAAALSGAASAFALSHYGRRNPEGVAPGAALADPMAW